MSSFREKMQGNVIGKYKVFRHNPIIMPDLQEDMRDLGRFYITPDGNAYPSMTTVLSILNKDAITKWRKRVGEEEANKISKEASERGTRVHQICEWYIDNKVDMLTDLDHADLQTFKNMKFILDQNLDDIRIQEVALYSDELQMAGRTDVIGRYRGKLSVVDFKTSKKQKKEEWIKHYFIQVSGYAKMWNEIHGNKEENIHQGVVIISPDRGEPQVFVVKTCDYMNDLYATRATFKEMHNV